MFFVLNKNKLPTQPFSKEKHPIVTKLGASYNNLPKIHPIYVIWAPSSPMKPLHRYTKFCKKGPKRHAHKCIPCLNANEIRNEETTIYFHYIMKVYGSFFILICILSTQLPTQHSSLYTMPR